MRSLARTGRVGWLAGVVVAACSGATLPLVTPADVERARATSPDTSAPELERGRALYASRCGQCHEPLHPRSRDAEGWDAALDEMAPRARLKSDDRRLVRAYLYLFARR